MFSLFRRSQELVTSNLPKFLSCDPTVGDLMKKNKKRPCLLVPVDVFPDSKGAHG